MAPVETSHTNVSAIACRRFGKLIEKSAGQMSQGMTTKRITAEQNDIDCEDHRPNADAKHTFSCPWIDKPKRFPHVIGEDQNENESEIEKIAVNVLHNQRERTFAQISLSRFPDRACRRISPERFIVGAPVVVTGQTKSTGRPKDQ